MAAGDDRATSFGKAVGDYDRGRPSYGAAAVAWALDGVSGLVADVGAGSGKLTAALVAMGHEVVAVDPDPHMLAALRVNVPGVEATEGSAERTGLPTGCAGAIVLGQAWHWVRPAEAEREAARVLAPGGTLAALWNVRDEREPWVAELTEAMHPSPGDEYVAAGGVAFGDPFGETAHRAWEWAREMTLAELDAMVRSRSYYINADDAGRERITADVATVVGRAARDGVVTLPYVTHAYRARL